MVRFERSAGSNARDTKQIRLSYDKIALFERHAGVTPSAHLPTTGIVGELSLYQSLDHPACPLRSGRAIDR